MPCSARLRLAMIKNLAQRQRESRKHSPSQSDDYLLARENAPTHFGLQGNNDLPPAPTRQRIENPIEKVEVSAYKIPTEAPESDGTYRWDSTTLVLVEVTAAGATGLGYTYADSAAAILIRDKLADEIKQKDALDVQKGWSAVVRAIRNLGRPGIASMAISAVDIALRDLKAKILRVPLVSLLGRSRDSIPVYGSGGFTSYSLEQIAEQLGGWAASGMRFVKMKIGREPERDLERVKTARKAIGEKADLFVDANGAYGRKQALQLAQGFADLRVTWYEEPVSSDDLEGLRFIRAHMPASMEVAAGEYGYSTKYFLDVIEAVDVLQADVTRCAGITGLIQAMSLCKAFSIPFSAHTAPTVHTNVCCSTLADVRHIEYFHDHERIEHMLFEGASTPVKGELFPNETQPGLGIAFKHADAKRYAISLA